MDWSGAVGEFLCARHLVLLDHRLISAVGLYTRRLPLSTLSLLELQGPCLPLAIPTGALARALSDISDLTTRFALCL